MTADTYFYQKFIEWQQKGNGDYRTYVRTAGRSGIKTDLLNDGETFKQEICTYLKTYTKGQEKQGVLSVIQGIANPDRDILEIIVGATLDACGIPDVGNTLIGLAILGIIGAALIALLGSRR
ncbi:MAG: hypothetical protein QW837_09260 [Conexivisphaerales archaeon]